MGIGKASTAAFNEKRPLGGHAIRLKRKIKLQALQADRFRLLVVRESPHNCA